MLQWLNCLGNCHGSSIFRNEMAEMKWIGLLCLFVFVLIIWKLWAFLVINFRVNVI